MYDVAWLHFQPELFFIFFFNQHNCNSIKPILYSKSEFEIYTEMINAMLANYILQTIKIEI